MKKFKISLIVICRNWHLFSSYISLFWKIMSNFHTHPPHHTRYLLPLHYSSFLNPVTVISKQGFMYVEMFLLVRVFQLNSSHSANCFRVNEMWVKKSDLLFSLLPCALFTLQYSALHLPCGNFSVSTILCIYLIEDCALYAITFLQN